MSSFAMPMLSSTTTSSDLEYDMNEWYVCARGGEPEGPYTTNDLARHIVADHVPRDAFVACVGDASWQDLLDVPEIVAALKAL
jgi:hypothetical protein